MVTVKIALAAQQTDRIIEAQLDAAGQQPLSVTVMHALTAEAIKQTAHRHAA